MSRWRYWLVCSLTGHRFLPSVDRRPLVRVCGRCGYYCGAISGEFYTSYDVAVAGEQAFLGTHGIGQR